MRDSLMGGDWRSKGVEVKGGGSLHISEVVEGGLGSLFQWKQCLFGAPKPATKSQ